MPPEAAPAAPATPAAPAAPAAPAPEAKPAEAPAAPDSLVGAAVEKPAEAEAKPGDKPGDKPAEAKPADAPAVEYKDFTLPEGVKADDPVLGQFKEAAAKAGVSQEQAQSLIDAFGGKLIPADLAQQQIEAVYNEWRQTQDKWVETVKADPELGGSNFDNMRSTIAKAINEIGGKEAKSIREAFNFTGAGNNPDIIRAFYRLAKAVVEPGHVNGKGPSGESQKDFSSMAARLYGEKPRLANGSTS